MIMKTDRSISALVDDAPPARLGVGHIDHEVLQLLGRAAARARGGAPASHSRLHKFSSETGEMVVLASRTFK